MVVEGKMNIRPLSAALQRVAEEELKETPEKMVKYIQLLQEWIKQQPHLRRVKPTHQWLVAFLRGCKYDLDKAKSKIDMYYTMKATVPEFFGNRDPFDPKIQEILNLGPFLPLRRNAKEDAPRVCVSRPGGNNVSLVDYIKVCLMIAEILLLEDDNFVVAGEAVIADLKDTGFRFVIQWTPALARKTLISSEKALSIRMKSLHIVNPIFGLSTALAIFKMFLNAKVKNRIYSLNKDEKLSEYLDKSILPEEYGGTGDSLQELIDYWKQKVESYRDWFMDENACSDETKRTDQKKIFGGFFS